MTDIQSKAPLIDALDHLVGSQDAYTAHFKAFIKWLVNAGYGEITMEAVREYFEELNRSEYSAGTVGIRRQAVKKRVRQLFLNADIEQKAKIDRFLDELDTGPTRVPKHNPENIGKDKYLSTAEIDRLKEGCRSERQRLFIRFLLATGCRVAELTGIRNHDCRVQGELIVIRVVGKGRKERHVKLPIGLYREIQTCFAGTQWLFETGGQKPYLARYITGQIAKLGIDILNRKISAHSLRHTFATQMIRRGVMIDALSRYLGHSSVSITLNLYCHNELSDDEIASYISEIAA